EALAPSLAAFKPLIPYILIFIVTAAAYAFLLDAHLDEHTAPIILPMIILMLLVYEHCFSKSSNQEHQSYEGEVRPTSLETAVRGATSETTVHIGALLSIMALSLTVGGVIEDSGIFDQLADQTDLFSNQWTTMLALVLALVIVGMIMDPFGAIILVSGTVAQAAYKQGIDPLHFWMITLVAFELGYLSPPVAVNHLLTRQVVGEEEIERAKEETRGKSFWIRHERYMLPLTVMSIALVLVAFGPLVYQQLF
ncbi:MAG: TRAP transporter large permease subunit, partial [Ketobacter sp.]